MICNRTLSCRGASSGGDPRQEGTHQSSTKQTECSVIAQPLISEGQRSSKEDWNTPADSSEA